MLTYNELSDAVEKLLKGSESDIHLYKHLLYLKDTADEVNGFIEILTTDNTPFTSQTLFDKVKANGGKYQYAVSPYRPNNNMATIEIHGLGYNNSTNTFQLVALDFRNLTSQNLQPRYVEYTIGQSAMTVISEDIEQVF